ncbi:MAG: ABC transporter permease [Piscirickettsiaceae bacterium]|jgi:ABC-2 type transport system permease protein|nr:ABC transporter permease [Piscirickettsiaceae bacterium]
MLSLARHELYRLFLSPLAWLILALSQLILAYLFLTHIDYFMQIQGKIAAIPGAPGVTELVVLPLFNNAATILLLLTPLITMRLIAEERRNESFPLLLSAPLSATQIILGKYFGTLGFFLILLILITFMPLSLSAGTTLDFTALASGLFGLLLLVASFTAIGLFLSSLTKQPTIAAISTFSLLFLLWIIDWAGNTGESTLLSWLSLLSHFQPILQGDIQSKDIAYYGIIIMFFLTLTIHRINAERLS